MTNHYSIFKSYKTVISVNMALGDERICRPSYYLPMSNHSLLIFSDSFDIDHFLITSDYAISPHQAPCKIKNCEKHVLICCAVRTQEKLLEDLAAYRFNYIEPDDLYSYYRFMIHGDKTLVHGPLMENLKHAVNFAHDHPRYLPQPSVMAKRVARKRTKFHEILDKSRNIKTISIQTIDTSLQKRINGVLDGPYALEFMKVLDCMYDRHGEVKTHKVEFSIRK